MKIKRFKIQNFRNLKEVEAQPDGCHILLLGDNSVGKSSTIEAILSALGKKNNPLNPININESSAYVEVEGTDGTIFKVKFNKNGNPNFEVIAPNGLKDSRKSSIQQIVGGDLDFDVFKFVEGTKTAEGRRQQIELIKSLMPLDIIEKYNEIERDIISKENLRAEVRKTRDIYDKLMKGSNIEKYHLEQYKEKISEDELVQKINEATENNNKIKKANEAIVNHNQRIKEIDELIKKLTEEKNERIQKVEKINEWLSQNKEIDVSEFTEKLSKISEHNFFVEKVKEYLENSEKFDEYDKKFNVLNNQIQEKKQEKINLIKNSNAIPIQGLWFDEDKLYLNQIPIDSDTLSTSQIMSLGIQIMIAKNPKMKIMCIARGESLGKQRLKEIQALAEKYGYQIIMEQVIRDKDELKIEFYCEGEDLAKIK